MIKSVKAVSSAKGEITALSKTKASAVRGPIYHNKTNKRACPIAAASCGIAEGLYRNGKSKSNWAVVIVRFYSCMFCML